MTLIRMESRDDIVIAHMTHGKANVLDLEFCHELIRLLNELATANARGVVLTGQGSMFSAGVDLLRYQHDGPQYRGRFVPAISQLVLTLLRFPRPLVAAINGHAVAGGCVMACAADHRVMARGAGRIGVPELLVGLPFPVAALEAVRLVVPPHQLHGVVYGGATYAPDDALAVGLVDEVVEADALLEHAIKHTARLAAVPADVFAQTKLTLRAPTFANIAAGAERDEQITAIWKEPETLARVHDYVERTFKRSG